LAAHTQSINIITTTLQVVGSRKKNPVRIADC
jgi:hypothetical protein